LTPFFQSCIEKIDNKGKKMNVNLPPKTIFPINDSIPTNTPPLIKDEEATIKTYHLGHYLSYLNIKTPTHYQWSEIPGYKIVATLGNGLYGLTNLGSNLYQRIVCGKTDLVETTPPQLENPIQNKMDNQSYIDETDEKKMPAIPDENKREEAYKKLVETRQKIEAEKKAKMMEEQNLLNADIMLKKGQNYEAQKEWLDARQCYQAVLAIYEMLSEETYADLISEMKKTILKMENENHNEGLALYVEAETLRKERKIHSALDKYGKAFDKINKYIDNELAQLIQQTIEELNKELTPTDLDSFINRHLENS
jgi:tetratricopeptide (TPR) repeat protein